jgi:predicted RNase H-like nuclease (RuvC/YqgF family)
MINFSQDTMHQLVQIHVERINALELALKNANNRIEQLEWDLHMQKSATNIAVLEAEIKTMDWINSKLNG